MNVRHTWIGFFVLTLGDGDTGISNAEITIHTGTEGRNIDVACSFSVSGSRNFFCKDKCEGKGVLIETDDDKAQRGRYRIHYKVGTDIDIMSVTITNLTKSDAGRYRCALDRGLAPDSYEDFEIRVKEAPNKPKPSRTPRPVPTSTTTPQSSSSTPPSTSSDTTKQSQLKPPTGPGLPLYVRLTLVALIIVSSAVALLIFCWKRNRAAEEPRVDSDYVNVPGVDTVYDDVGQEHTSTV